MSTGAWRIVGTFMLADRDGEPVVIRRYTATAEEGPDQLVKRIMADLHNALRQDPALKVGVIQDGAPELWNLIRGALEQEPLVKHWVEGVDRFHLYEHLWDALNEDGRGSFSTTSRQPDAIHFREKRRRFSCFM
jgi:hypothetical protein